MVCLAKVILQIYSNHSAPALVLARKRLSREFVTVENISPVCLLDLTADDIEVKTNTKLTPNCQLREKSKSGIPSCLYTVTLTPISA